MDGGILIVWLFAKVDEKACENLNMNAHSCQIWNSFLSTSLNWLFRKRGPCSMTCQSLEQPANRVRQIIMHFWMNLFQILFWFLLNCFPFSNRVNSSSKSIFSSASGLRGLFYTSSAAICLIKCLKQRAEVLRVSSRSFLIFKLSALTAKFRVLLCIIEDSRGL